MQQLQREMFSKGLIDLANLGIAALVFGQFVSGHGFDIGVSMLGIAFGLVFYIGAFSMSLERNKNR